MIYFRLICLLSGELLEEEKGFWKVTSGSAYHPVLTEEGEAMGKEEGWAEKEEAADGVEVANSSLSQLPVSNFT